MRKTQRTEVTIQVDEIIVVNSASDAAGLCPVCGQARAVGPSRTDIEVVAEKTPLGNPETSPGGPPPGRGGS